MSGTTAQTRGGLVLNRAYVCEGSCDGERRVGCTYTCDTPAPDAGSTEPDASIDAGPREEFGARLAAYADEGGLDPTQVLLRSAAVPGATPLLRAALEREFLEPLARWLGGRDAALRAGLIVSVLSGVAIMRDVLAVKGLGPAATPALTREMARLLQQYVDMKP